MCPLCSSLVLSTPFHSCLISSNAFSWISFLEGDAQFCLFSPLHPISLHFCLRQSQESIAHFLSWLPGSNWLPPSLGQRRRVESKGCFCVLCDQTLMGSQARFVYSAFTWILPGGGGGADFSLPLVEGLATEWTDCLEQNNTLGW